MNTKDFFRIFIGQVWSDVTGAVLSVVGAIAFFYPDLQPVLTWPTISQFLPWYWWIILGLIVWAIGIAFEAAKVLGEKRPLNLPSVKAEGSVVGEQNVVKSHNIIVRAGNGGQTITGHGNVGIYKKINFDTDPPGHELAVKMGVDVQSFGKQLGIIRRHQPQRRFDQYIVARAFLDKIRDETLLEGNMVFRNADQIGELIFELDRLTNSYASELGILEFREDEHRNWRKTTEKPPQELIDGIKESFYLLWGDGQLEDKINLSIKQLVDLLRLEGEERF